MIQSFIIPVFGAEPLAGVDMESSLVSNYSNQVLSIKYLIIIAAQHGR